MTATILVVEDQPAMRRNMSIGLEMAGYEIVTAADGVEALDVLYPLVRSLRRRLGYEAGETGCIESVRGIGYRLAL